MKKILYLIIMFICLFNFTPIVNAVNNPSRITVSRTGKKYEFIDDLVIYEYKSGGYHVYLLENDQYYSSSTSLNDYDEVTDGFRYIVNNANPSSNTNHNYYITQAAVLWYQDYINGNDYNIDASIKEYIENNTSNNSICKYIYNLVNGAINYYDYESDAITFETQNVTFSKVGANYISNQIKINTNNLSAAPTAKLVNAPTNAKISSKKLYKDGEGFVYISIPSNYYNKFIDSNFELRLTGTSQHKLIFKYSNNGYDEVIYSKTYNDGTSNVSVSLPISLNEDYTSTKLRIKVLDENDNYIKNIMYKVYRGNCENTTCYSSNLVHSFTTTSTYTTLNNILESGTYTFVRSTNTNYDLNEKEVIYVSDSEDIQTFIFTEGLNTNTSTSVTVKRYKDVTIKNSINKSSNVIKIFKNDGTLYNSYRSNNTNYTIKLYDGYYYIIDSQNLIEVYFKIVNGVLYIKDGGVYKEYSNIDLDGYYKNYINEDEVKDDKLYDNKDVIVNKEDGKVHIENLDGISSIDISQEIDTSVDVEVDWLSNIIDCPQTMLSSTIKYIIGAIILALGTILTIKNVKKSKNNM